jgi:predicted dienelactone hydrolase
MRMWGGAAGVSSQGMRNWRGAEKQELRVTVWYPAPVTAVEVQQVIGPPDAPLFEAGMASPNAPMEPALRPLPLIVLSHGTGGSAMQMAWLGTALARAGFIVAAVDHPGNNSRRGVYGGGFCAVVGARDGPERGDRWDAGG